MSLTAEMCPHCGERRLAKRSSQGNAVGVLLALVGGMVALVVLLGSLQGTSLTVPSPIATPFYSGFYSVG